MGETSGNEIPDVFMPNNWDYQKAPEKKPQVLIL